MTETIIRFEHVTKKYDEQTTVLNDVSFTMKRGKFYTLLGPSGCGKTTILRLIAGFLEPTEGNIYFNGEKMNDVPANKRQVNTVFQDYALFPHLNVFENIAFGLRIKKMKKKEIDERVHQALSFVNLEGFGKKDITAMSGGQRQRVAIARAIVNEPDIVLLDEPLSALDLKLRTAMQSELRELQQRLGKTFIFVTHDQEEALAMSDEIFVMNEGVIQQAGSPFSIYDQPINRFVADFIGESNIVEGTVIDQQSIQFSGHTFNYPNEGFATGEQVDIVIRPEDLMMSTPEFGNITGTVTSQLFRGVHYELITLDEHGNEWLVHSTKKAPVGSTIGLQFNAEDLHVMHKQ